MYSVYILRSKVCERYYVGSTEDVAKRVDIHNGAHARWTKRYQPWELVYEENFATRGEAIKRERELKRSKNLSRLLQDR